MCDERCRHAPVAITFTVLDRLLWQRRALRYWFHGADEHAKREEQRRRRQGLSPADTSQRGVLALAWFLAVSQAVAWLAVTLLAWAGVRF